MSILIKNIEDVKKHITVGNFTYSIIEKYLKKADRKYIEPVIGTAMYDNYIADIPTEPTALKVYDILCEASANLGYFRYATIGSVSVSNNGIMISENANSKNAEWWRIRDLKREFLNSGMEAIDEALEKMETNEDMFPLWKSSGSYTVFKELYVSRTDVFQRWFNINSSRLTFIALRPFLLEAQHQYINSFLGNETAMLIKSQATKEAKEAMVLVQAAQVNFAVANAAATGMFELSDNSLSIKDSQLPDSKANKTDDRTLEKIVSTRSTAGTEYLKQLSELLKSNSQVFTAHATIVKTTNIKVHNTKSTLAI